MAASTAAQNPRKQPQQRRSRATVDKILAAAAQVLAEEGDGATTDRIAARAGVSIGSLYQYFPNKGALMLELARRHMAAAGEVLDHVLRLGRPRSVWLPEAVAAVAALHEDGDLHRVLYDHAASTPALAEAFEQTNEALRSRVEELLRAETDLADPGTTAQVLVGLVVFMVYGSILWGVLPTDPSVSWQGHLGGFAGGVLAAWLQHGRTARAR